MGSSLFRVGKSGLYDSAILCVRSQSLNVDVSGKVLVNHLSFNKQAQSSGSKPDATAVRTFQHPSFDRSFAALERLRNRYA